MINIAEKRGRKNLKRKKKQLRQRQGMGGIQKSSISIKTSGKFDSEPFIKGHPATWYQKLADEIMNYLRKNNLKPKVVFDYHEREDGLYDEYSYDIDNTGTTPHILSGPMHYVHYNDRIKEEAGLLGRYGLGGTISMMSKVVLKKFEQSEMITAFSQREGEYDDKIFGIHECNPNSRDVKEVGIEAPDVDTMAEYVDYDFDFRVKDRTRENEFLLKPDTNFVFRKLPCVDLASFTFDNDNTKENRTPLAAFSDYIRTIFCDALDKELISVYIRVKDKNGKVVEQHTIDKGALFIDEHGNLLPYSKLTEKPFQYGKPHQFPGRYLQSSECTSTHIKEAKNQGTCIFGNIPEFNMLHLDNYQGYVMEQTARVILGNGNSDTASGYPYNMGFIELDIDNVRPDFTKLGVDLPMATPIKDISKVDESNRVYMPDYTTESRIKKWYNLGKINRTHFRNFFKTCNPKLSVPEPKRRDIVWNLFGGKVPHDENGNMLISMNDINEILKIYGIYKKNISSIKWFSREISLYDGLIYLDLGLIVIDKNGEEYHIANEWKVDEKKINRYQIISEIHGWEKEHGKLPNEFIISCHSVDKNEPDDSHSNFLPTTIDIVNKLRNKYPTIKFTLMDTRYFDLAKKYNNYKAKF